MQLHDPRIILPFPTEGPQGLSLTELCDRVTDGFLIPFYSETEEVIAEKIARVRQSAIQQGTPTSVIAEIPWLDGAKPSGIAMALARGVDWILASNITSLEELHRFQLLLRAGNREVPLIVRLPENITPVFAEELLIAAQGIWGTISSLTPSLLQLAHQLGKFTVFEANSEQDIPPSHALYLPQVPNKRPVFAPLSGDPQVGNDVVWAADALRSRRSNSKLILICENIEEVGFASSLSFHHPAIVVCNTPQLLRSSNLFRGYPVVLDLTRGNLQQLFLSCEERLSALRLVKPGDTLIFVTENLSSICCRSL